MPALPLWRPLQKVVMLGSPTQNICGQVSALLRQLHSQQIKQRRGKSTGIQCLTAKDYKPSCRSDTLIKMHMYSPEQTTSVHIAITILVQQV